MRGHGPSGPIACPLTPLISGPVPLTGGLGSTFPDAGRSRVLRNMEGSVEAIVLLARMGPGWLGCAIGGGPNIRRWVSKDFYLRRSGKNRLGWPSRSSRLGSGGWWEAARSEWRFHW